MAVACPVFSYAHALPSLCPVCVFAVVVAFFLHFGFFAVGLAAPSHGADAGPRCKDAGCWGIPHPVSAQGDITWQRVTEQLLLLLLAKSATHRRRHAHAYAHTGTRGHTRAHVFLPLFTCFFSTAFHAGCAAIKRSDGDKPASRQQARANQARQGGKGCWGQQAQVCSCYPRQQCEDGHQA